MARNEYKSDKLIQEFGLQFMDHLAVIKGRVLTPPKLEFGDGRTEEPREGRWNFNNKVYIPWHLWCYFMSMYHFYQ